MARLGFLLKHCACRTHLIMPHKGNKRHGPHLGKRCLDIIKGDRGRLGGRRWTAARTAGWLRSAASKEKEIRSSVFLRRSPMSLLREGGIQPQQSKDSWIVSASSQRSGTTPPTAVSSQLQNWVKWNAEFVPNVHWFSCLKVDFLVRGVSWEGRARHTLTTDRLTYDCSSTCSYSGGGWLEPHTADILSRERGVKKKAEEETSQFREHSRVTRCTNLFGHLGNKTLHEEIRNKEADCRNAAQSRRWGTALTARERSLVPSIWTCS